jgi:VWFA-related protein
VKRLLAAVLIAAAPLLAQTHSESITVEVVDVPVYVIGPRGPVSNLTKNDFELFVNGKRQQIDYFDTIEFNTTARTPSAAAAPPRDIRDRRLFLLMFDMTFSRPNALSRAQKAAVTMLRHAQPSDYFAVATFSATKGAKFVTPFTNDLIVNERAVLRLRPSDARDPLGVAISATEHDATVALGGEQTLQAQPADGKDAAAEAELQQILDTGADLRQMPVKRLIEPQVTDLSAISTRLSHLEGYKHVIFLSEGFSSYYATGARPNLGMGKAPDVDAHLIRVMDDMAKAFRAAGAFIDTIDLSVREATNSDPLVNESLSMLARSTGGQFVHNRNNLVEAFNEITTTTGNGYRLGFKPVDAKKGDNTIEVKVRNVPASTIVSYRTGFSTTPAPAKANIDPLRLADILLNDTPQSGIAPKIGFGQRPYLLIGLPAQALVAQNNGRPVDARVLLYIFDANRNAVDFKEKRLTIPPDAKGDLVIRNAMKAGSGSYTAKALIVAGDNVGFNKQSFRIP